MWRSYVTNHLYYLFCTMTGKRLPTHVGAKKSNKTQLVWAHGKLLAIYYTDEEKDLPQGLKDMHEQSTCLLRTVDIVKK